MNLLPEAYAALRDFFEAGGGVLYGILFVTVLMWTFIVERAWYFLVALPRHVEVLKASWDARPDTTSWYAKQIRQGMISELRVAGRRHLLLVKSLMAVLPLLGLLGTVTGMIAVFDVMALAGTGNARLMAAGVSRATIPTMAGLVAALSGLYFVSWLEKRARLEVDRAGDRLAHH